MIKHIKTIALGASLLASSLYAQDVEIVSDSTQTTTQAEDDLDILDDPILDQWDQLISESKKNPNAFYVDTAYTNLVNTFPSYSDEQYMDMLEALDDNSPMKLDYNKKVRQYINYWVDRGRIGTIRVMGRSELYFPMIEEILYEQGMPMEFKYLAVVESALNPKAKSRAGATGLWQFMYNTGKENGLKIDSYVDERMDPIKSTYAACKYLSRLYRIYGDWNLVLAAYNCGPGNVNKAIRRSGGKRDYWEISPYLPKETRGYVPAFVAVNFAFENSAEFNLFPLKPGFTYADVDTVHVKQEISFDHIKLYLDISTAELEYLNPVYYRKIIPKSQVQVPLTLPRDLIGDFINAEAQMYNLNPKKARKSNAELVAQTTSSGKGDGFYYKVKSGDVLGTIATRNNVSITQIKSWNNLRSSRIYPGQKLFIAGNKPKINKAAIANKTADVSNTDGKRYHTVQQGDTLWDIAKLYNGVSVNDIKRLNYNLNDRQLKPGQKILISG